MTDVSYAEKYELKKNLRVGDVVLIEAIVAQKPSDENGTFVYQRKDGIQFDAMVDDIHLVWRWVLAPGDRVFWDNSRRSSAFGTVLGIDGDQVWIKTDHGGYIVERANELRRVGAAEKEQVE